ncbi:hypothetical protein [Pseudomonas protegens]|uniref:hypothetical protein n=1 Tax=Pseudomonas protegens TaxID=380021 RepID=UPI001B313807|nr:hypothetical protein [Pseudomonas protegens]MBP5100778.1 hypothetical protein [Pseudomonas protegens]MBP5100922.1 hypothetical protein [Pseudomonas protegens]QTU07676.1 hypothetical protein HUT25_18615 [Pseudomonas protegens]QTU13986.1 hypothetical protein HUT23_19305 [Pseudomonas protegens]QTU38634.1 hypothetical protein HUT24_13000 [Pseudomonas protegens]
MTNPLWSGSGTTTTTPGHIQRVLADVTRYINKVPNESGWLLVGMDNVPRENWPFLFKYCKVTLTFTKDQKTYFKILEGAHKGKTAFLSEANAKEYLGKIAPKKKPVELVMVYGRFNDKWMSITRDRALPQQLANGTLDGIHFEAAMNTVWGLIYSPIPPGTYSILLPDVPHAKDYTEPYKAEYPNLSHHQVWFPIDHGDKSRYVHVGNVSEGCVTVVSLNRWSAIHEALVSHRSPDGNSVGTLIVKGKPARTQ